MTKNEVSSYSYPGIQIVLPDYIRKILKYFDVSWNDILQKTKKDEVMIPRQFIMYYEHLFTVKSYLQIAEDVGLKSHANVIHAIKKIDTLKLIDAEYKKYYNDLSLLIKNQ